MSAIHSILRDGFAGDLTTVRYLQLLCGFTLEEAARFCLVAPETFRRWRMDRPPNRAAIRLLAIRAGWIPWPGWKGWLCVNGELVSPDWSTWSFTPGEIASLPLLHSQIAALKCELAWIRSGAAGLAVPPPLVVEDLDLTFAQKCLELGKSAQK